MKSDSNPSREPSIGLPWDRRFSLGGSHAPIDEDCPLTRVPDSTDREGAKALFAGRYEIIKELGRGGMGVVTLARDTRLPRAVAIKAPLRSQDPVSLKRFFKEAEAAAKLDHPNICRILDLGEVDGLPYIVLAHIPGRTLAEVVGRRAVDPIKAAKLTRGLARTIHYAHERGIIHRDLKPSNLMVSPHRHLIVMDFGLARLEGGDRETQTGQVIGTVPYMSPEQVQGLVDEMGTGCDIYSLGVIFYELLTGHRPFEGEAWDLPRQIVRDEPLPPSAIFPDLDPELDDIVLRALAKKARDRYRSMDEFARAIADHLRRLDFLSDSAVASKKGSSTGSGPVEVVVPPSVVSELFSVELNHQPLRDPVPRSLSVRDGLIWAAVLVMGLIGLNLFVSWDRPKPSGPKEVPKLPGDPNPEKSLPHPHALDSARFLPAPHCSLAGMTV